jgi:unspecific monooxygenase
VFTLDEAAMADRLRAAFARVSAAPVGSRRRFGLAECEEIVADAGLGLIVAGLGPRLRTLVLDAARAAQAGAAATVRLPIAFSPTRRRIVRANDRLFDELVARVRRRRAAPSGSEPRDLLDLLLADGADEPGERLTDADIAQVLAANLANLPAVAGAALSWLLVMVAAHGTEPPPARSGREWRAAFVNETLRLHPPVWIIVRRVHREVAVAGYALAAGSQVLVSPKLTHLDPRWWSRDPSVFDAARWFDAEPHARHAFLPYGAGPRVCTGAQLAQAILETAFDVLRADWTVVSGIAEPKPKLATVVTPDRLRLSLHARGSR